MTSGTEAGLAGGNNLGWLIMSFNDKLRKVRTKDFPCRKNRFGKKMTDYHNVAFFVDTTQLSGIKLVTHYPTANTLSNHCGVGHTA